MVVCVAMLSISSLFYIIVGQFLFSRMLHLVPISGYAGGLDAVKFLILPVLLSLLARLGTEARLYRAMFLEEIGKDYVRTARAKGLSETLVLFRHVLQQRADPDHHQRRLATCRTSSSAAWCSRASSAFRASAPIVIDAISGQDFAIVRSMVFLGAALYIASYVVIDLAYTWADPRVRLT